MELYIFSSLLGTPLSNMGPGLQPLYPTEKFTEHKHRRYYILLRRQSAAECSPVLAQIHQNRLTAKLRPDPLGELTVSLCVNSAPRDSIAEFRGTLCGREGMGENGKRERKEKGVAP